MARKKSVGGRARGVTAINKLQRDIDKTNRRLNALDKANSYGKYSSKKLLRQVSNNKLLKYDRKSKNKLKLNLSLAKSKSLESLKKSELRLLDKQLKEFLKSQTSTPIGLKRAMENTRKEVKAGLSRLTDKDISDEDLEDFYELLYSDDFNYFSDKIGDSEVYVLIDEAKDKSSSEEDFIALLNRYITVNSEEAREKAKNLYDKYVKG